MNGKQQSESNRGAADEALDAAAAGAPDASTGGGGAPPESEIEALRREAEELRDKNLRLLAEMRNTMARAQREKSESLEYAEADFAREVLIVLDGLERTCESAQSASDAKTVADGVRIVLDQFLQTLRKFGIESIPAVGRPFDPAVHEALMQQPSSDVPPGSVLSEIARGYRMKGRVLRTAKVIVAKAEE